MQAEATPGSVSASHAVFRTATASGVILACGIVTGLISARTLGPAGRGELATITIWAGTLLYAGTLGLSEAVTYFAAAEPALRTRVWMTAQVAAVILGTLVTIAGWLILPRLFAGSDASVVAWIQWYLLLFAVPCMSSLFACSWLQGVGRITAFNVSRVTVHAANAAGFVLVLVAGTASVWHFAIALLVGNAATWLLACGLGPWRPVRGQGPSQDLARRMLHYGMRVQVGNWSNSANVRLDQLLLSLFAAPASLGVYVVAVTYANVMMTLPGSATMVMLPEMVKEHRQGTARTCLARWYRRVLWTTAAGCTVIAVAGIYLVPFLFGSAFAAAVPLLALLGPATLLLGMNQVLMTAFQGVDRPEIGSAAEVVALVVTATALVVLLPRFGMYGAALASLLAYGTCHFYLLRKAMTIFDAELRSLCVPTRGDVHAMVRVLSARTQAGAIP